jgi:hypothetical protein
MKTMTSHLSPLLAQIASTQVCGNISVLADKICTAHHCQLFGLSADKNEYMRYLTMFDGTLKSVVDVEKLNISLQQAAIPFLKDRTIVVVLHDCCSIRKPYSAQLEALGTVKDLDNTLINGFDTFNSVMVDLKGKSIQLLATTPFSNGDMAFVSQKERYLYDNGQIKCATRRVEIAALDEAKTSYNLKSLVQKQITAVHVSIRAVNPTATIIDIFDRGFDGAALFELETAEDSSFIVRGKNNRNNACTITPEVGIEAQIEQKLSKQAFKYQFERDYQKVSFKGKVYQDAKAVFEYTPVCVDEKWYSAVRVSFFDRNGKTIFKNPMLLITNLEVNSDALALLVYEMYLQRSAIEGVFRFCKQELGWESPRLHDWEAMKNLLTFVFFLSAYFYEIKQAIVDDPLCQWLAQLGNGKGEVSPHFLLLGLGKVASFIEIQRLIDNKTISLDDINAAKIAFGYEK